jgi:transcriptional regulator with PAS, ATPase and Fis domain
MTRQQWMGEGVAREAATGMLEPFALEAIVGDSAGIRRLHGAIQDVAHTNATVLVRGESGVGKELVARAVHRLSARAEHPFVVVDCASLHENLLQSELFGHEQGAYTGAVRQKAGLFEAAHRGSLFLDEIAELTPALQVKLLRVLQSHTFRRLGGTADLRVDVRVIAATNRSLEELMTERQFREDLYYRLNVFPIEVPPLRDRREDIPRLVEHFVHRGRTTSHDPSPAASEASLAMLSSYDWPGNVRELEHVVERALILSHEATIQPEHLPAHLQVSDARVAGASEPPMALAEVERRHIAHVLDYCNGHRERAARLLQISTRTLYRRIKECAL